MPSFAQYGPGQEELPVNASRGILRRNTANDGWEEKTPENILNDAAAAIDVNGQKITNVAEPVDPSDACTRYYADVTGINAVFFGAYNLISSTFSTGTSQPASLADSLFTGFVPGGSIAGEGVVGVISASFNSLANETGTGANQGGLGSVTAADQPYNTTDFAGQRVPVQMLRNDGAAVSLADVLAAPPVGQGGQRVECFLAYRSDLGANLKWRMWYYYRRTSDGYLVAFTPDISIIVSLYTPIVEPLAQLPVGFALGEIAATPGAAGVTAGVLADIQNVGIAAAAGSSGRFSDAQHIHSHGQQPAGSQGGLAHNLADGTDNGFMSSADFLKLSGLPATAVSTATQVIAGAGLTGGGTLNTDVGLDIVANADGSIVVNANDIQVGVLATDAQHGTRGGGTLHPEATQITAGFLSAADKAKLDAISGDSFSVTTQTNNATPFDIAAYTLADNKAITFQFTTTARKSDGTASAHFRVLAGFRRSGGTVTQVGTTKIIAACVDAGFGVTVDTAISGTTIYIRVTGLLATTIDWRSSGSSLVIAP
jgi:hypothetical protein